MRKSYKFGIVTFLSLALGMTLSYLAHELVKQPAPVAKTYNV